MYNKPAAEEALTQLEHAYAEVQNTPSFPALNNYISVLYTANNACAESPSVDMRAALAQHWLNRYRLQMTEPDKLQTRVKMLDTCIGHLGDTQVLARISCTAANNQLIACLFAERIYYAELDARFGLTSYTIGTITNWAMCEVRHETTPSLRSAIELFYGKSAWDLYSQDTPSPHLLPSYLWSLNLPLQVSPSASSTLYSSAQPPMDMV